MKFCTCCKKEKSLDSFHKHKNNKDGYQFQCIECRSIRTRIKRRLTEEQLLVADMFCIYETFLKNDPSKNYIGKSIMAYHFDGYKGSGNVIKRAMKKYGEENFTSVVLEVFDDEDECFLAERKCVEDRKPYYNIDKGGKGRSSGWSHKESSRKKMSISHIGKKLSPEHRASIGKKSIGRKHTDTAKKSVSEKNSGIRNGMWCGISNEQLVEAYEQTGSVRMAAEMVGMAYSTARARMSKLRKKGIVK